MRPQNCPLKICKKHSQNSALNKNAEAGDKEYKYSKERYKILLVFFFPNADFAVQRSLRSLGRILIQ